MNLMVEASLDSLAELESFLTDVVVEQTIDGVLTPKGRACKEALQSLRILVSKLEAVRAARERNDRQLQFCEMCED